MENAELILLLFDESNNLGRREKKQNSMIHDDEKAPMDFYEKIFFSKDPL